MRSARGPLAVLVAAAGASWEAGAIERVTAPGTGLLLARRCVDLPDLLATAATGGASVALLSPGVPGLDADSVARLRRSGLGLVVVADPGDLHEHGPERLRRLGLAHLLTTAELDALVETLTAAATEPEPGQPAEPVAGEVLPSVSGAGTTGRGHVVAVWGPAGAPGRTTVAVGLASEVAAAGRDALLLDVDAYGGAVAQHLGVLDEVSGLLAAARAANHGRLDPAGLAGMARQVGEHLRVLTGLPRPDRWHEVRPVALGDLLDEAVLLAPYVVVDLGFGLEVDRVDAFSGGPQRDELARTVVERADEVVVVGAADPVGLARLARGLVELREVVPAVRPWVVVNRTRPSLGWSDREIRGMIEGFLTPRDVHFLPDDRAAADRALMAGRSLAETGDSPLREALTALAGAVTGQPTVAGRRGRRRRAT